MAALEDACMITREQLLMAKIYEGLNALVELSHTRATAAGWWTENGKNLMDGDIFKYVAGTKIALVHSEVSEGLEGLRKNKQDDHLPHLPSFIVEMGDALIRIGDLIGAARTVAGPENVALFDFGRAVLEKMEYNSTRPDHKPENRAADGGKAF